MGEEKAEVLEAVLKETVDLVILGIKFCVFVNGVVFLCCKFG